VSIGTNNLSAVKKLVSVCAGGQIFARTDIKADIFILVINYLVAAFLVA
jgi:hypothetical protein